MTRTISAHVGTAVSYGFTAAMTSLCVMAAWTSVAPSRKRPDEACLSNLRQIGQMSRMYTDDYDGCLVPYVLMGSTATKTYAQLLIGYRISPSLLRCPLDHLGRPTPTPDRVPTTYGVNWYLSGSSGAFGSNIMPPRRYASIHDPGGTIWAADTALILASTAALPPSGWREDLAAAHNAELTFFYLPQDPNTGASTTGSWTQAQQAISYGFSPDTTAG